MMKKDMGNKGSAGFKRASGMGSHTTGPAPKTKPMKGAAKGSKKGGCGCG